MLLGRYETRTPAPITSLTPAPITSLTPAPILHIIIFQGLTPTPLPDLTHRAFLILSIVVDDE